MKYNFEIKIECKGDAVGTLGWFNSVLQKSELVIKNNKDGIPAMFLKQTEGDKTFYEFICCPYIDMQDTCGYITDDTFKWVHPIHMYNAHQVGLFDHPLTPACHKAVEEFIDKTVDKFVEWWNDDK